MKKQTKTMSKNQAIFILNDIIELYHSKFDELNYKFKNIPSITKAYKALKKLTKTK